MHDDRLIVALDVHTMEDVKSFVAGVGSLVALLAPYSSYGRIASNLLQPIYVFANNLIASITAITILDSSNTILFFEKSRHQNLAAE